MLYTPSDTYSISVIYLGYPIPLQYHRLTSLTVGITVVLNTPNSDEEGFSLDTLVDMVMELSMFSSEVGENSVADLAASHFQRSTATAESAGRKWRKPLGRKG